MASRIDAVESARTGESDEQDVWTWEGEFGEGSRRRGMREWGGAHRWGWRDWGFMALNEREGRVGRTEEVSWGADELRMIEHSLRAVQFEGHILRGICTSALIAPRRR